MAEKFFDKKEEYENEIAPLIKRLKQACVIARIPFFVTACIENTPDHSTYDSDGNFCGSGDFFLTDDKITKHLNIVAGFDTVPHRKELEIMMDDPDEMIPEQLRNLS